MQKSSCHHGQFLAPKIQFSYVSVNTLIIIMICVLINVKSNDEGMKWLQYFLRSIFSTYIKLVGYHHHSVFSDNIQKKKTFIFKNQNITQFACAHSMPLHLNGLYIYIYGYTYILILLKFKFFFNYVFQFFFNNGSMFPTTSNDFFFYIYFLRISLC